MDRARFLRGGALVGLGAAAAMLPARAEVPVAPAAIRFQRQGAGTVARSLEAELADTYKAQHFGLRADGATDDTAALNAAIVALSSAGGGELSLPAGTILVTAPVIGKPGVSLRGAGQFRTTIRCATRDTRLLDYTDVDVQGISLSHLTLRGVSGRGGTTGLFVGSGAEQTAHVRISNVRFLDHAKGIDGTGSPFGLFDSELTKCDFYNCSSWGLQAAGSQLVLTGCTFRVCGWGVAVTRLSAACIGGPRFFGCTWIQNAHDVVLDGPLLRPVLFSGCWFEQCKTAVVGTATPGLQTLLGLSFLDCLFQPGPTAVGTGVLQTASLAGIVAFHRCTVYASDYAPATLPGPGYGSLAGNGVLTRESCIVTNGATTTVLPDVNSNDGVNFYQILANRRYAGDAAAGAAGLAQGSLYYDTSKAAVNLKA